ncbi:hypothetical protein BG000_007935 [Podila horticola]|nr:hypothetical protein BG000_007935 [Podila horticola]
MNSAQCINKFTTLIYTSVSTAWTSTPNAFGYTDNKLVTSNGKRLVFSTDGSTITKVTTVNERNDATLQGVVPVPGPDGGASTWALAYSTQAGGFYGLMMSGTWEDQKAASIIGAVCAAIIVVLGVAGFFYWCRKKQQREAKKAEEPQSPDTKLEPLDENTPPPPPPPPGKFEVNEFNNAPILDSPLPSLPPSSQGQPQPQHQSQPYPSQNPQQFSQLYPQQFPQQSPQQFPQQYSQQHFPQKFPQHDRHPGQTFETYPGQQQPNPAFNTTQLIPSASSQSFSAPTQPYYQQQPSPSTTSSTPSAATNVASFNANANSSLQLQDIQFSSHPRPSVTNMVGGVNSQTVIATSASTPDQPPVGQL